MARIRERAPLIRLTDAACERLEYLMQGRVPRPLGVRILLKSRGCAAFRYDMEYVEDIIPGDERVEVSSTMSVFLQPKTIVFLAGTEMDYEESPTDSSFVFRNPHEKGRCGCGESFHV